MLFKAFRRKRFNPAEMSDAELKRYIYTQRGSCSDRDRVAWAQDELLKRNHKLEIDSNVLDSNKRGPLTW